MKFLQIQSFLVFFLIMTSWAAVENPKIENLNEKSKYIEISWKDSEGGLHYKFFSRREVCGVSIISYSEKERESTSPYAVEVVFKQSGKDLALYVPFDEWDKALSFGKAIAQASDTQKSKRKK